MEINPDKYWIMRYLIAYQIEEYARHVVSLKVMGKGPRDFREPGSMAYCMIQAAIDVDLFPENWTKEYLSALKNKVDGLPRFTTANINSAYSRGIGYDVTKSEYCDLFRKDREINHWRWCIANMLDIPYKEYIPYYDRYVRPLLLASPPDLQELSIWA